MISGNNSKEKGVVEEGKITIAEIEVQSIVPSLVRHIIKRYLKKVGLNNINVTHKVGNTPFTLKLIIEADVSKPLTREQKNRINYLVSTLEYLVAQANGNGSKLDPEELRTALAKVEPSLRKVYYKLN
ncbi:MAG: hypothetical protein ACP5LF_03130 [Nitrososphaeria archaeon]|nr:hypothetical protein [Conexivisphaerales archaeon]